MWSKCTSTGNAFQALLRLPIWAFWQSVAGKAVMDDGLEKIPLMAVCIFVVCMFGLPAQTHLSKTFAHTPRGLNTPHLQLNLG